MPSRAHRRKQLPEKFSAPWKGADPQRELDPPGNWFAPPGSNRSGGGGNEVVGAFGVEGRLGRLGKHTGRNVSER